jgi:hypothetical protein
MSADSPTNDPSGKRNPAGAGRRPITAEDLQAHLDARAAAPLSVPDEPLPDVPDLRRSSLAIKLRLLLRCYDLAARARRRWWQGACALTLLLALLGVAFCYLIAAVAFSGHDVLAGELMILLLSPIVVYVWLLRRKPAQAPGVDGMIAAIVRDHPDSVRDWGGEWVLRKRELAMEILRFEEKRQAAAEGPLAKPS